MILIATDTTLIANDLPSNQKYNKKKCYTNPRVSLTRKRAGNAWTFLIYENKIMLIDENKKSSFQKSHTDHIFRLSCIEIFEKRKIGSSKFIKRNH